MPYKDSQKQKEYFRKYNKARLGARKLKYQLLHPPRPKIFVSCLQCNKQFRARKSHIERGFNKYCSRVCFGISTRGRITDWLKGRRTWKLSIKTRKKLSEARKGMKSYLWRGGLSSKNKLIRQSLDYRLWREAVFARDNWTCKKCMIRGGKLNAHHIKPFSLFPELRFAIDNGVTLCFDCHRRTDTFGKGILNYQHIGEHAY